MKAAVAQLRKKRLMVLLANLLYFLAVLALGFLIFVKGQGGLLYGLVAAALIAYLALVRPLTARYKRSAREALLRENVCRGMKDFTYAPKEGFTAAEFQSAGLMPGDAGKAFLSRERVTARHGTLKLEMADVTFPVKVNGLNAMFNGMLLRITSEGAEFPQLRLDGENWGTAPVGPEARAALDEMKARGGQFLLQAGEYTMYLLARDCFIGFPVNPLLNITEKTMQAELLPEVRCAIHAAQALCVKKTGRKGRK